MIDPHLGHAAFRIGFYIAFVSGILSFLTEPASAERAISNFMFIIGVLFLIAISIMVRWSNAIGAAQERKQHAIGQKEVVNIEHTGKEKQ